MITGAAGQLGFELQRTAPSGSDVRAVDIAELDLTDAPAIDAFVRRHRPSVIINAAAFTAVDHAEERPDAAIAVNVTAAASLAQAARRIGARMIQISTDFVFSGATEYPWRPQDTTNPVSVYGHTKRDAEVAVLAALGEQALVIRTAWLYSAHGNNFVRTMLRLMAERDELHVIGDQIGTPTWANSLAHTVWAAVDNSRVSGTLHWTDAGVASWYDFAVAIQEEALARRLLPWAVPVHAIPSSAYATLARRPGYSVLDKSATLSALGVTPAHWRANLRRMLDELTDA